jgi:ABC-type lipoprotein export system ATPase subunit
MEIQTITLMGGYGKNENKDIVESITLKMGNIISIVGPTGSGKTTLINDLELFANRNTPSNRKVLINDIIPPEEMLNDPSKNPIALITQHTNFLSDLPVNKFLKMHASIRKTGQAETVVKETLDFANKLTGEPIIESIRMTELSGGQTRALLIADAVIIGNSPIILLDEIENAGINRVMAMELLKKYKKIFVFVTHDPRIALFSDFRIVMGNGAIQKVIITEEEEKKIAEEIKEIDDLMLDFRKLIRAGENIREDVFRERLKKINSKH